MLASLEGTAAQAQAALEGGASGVKLSEAAALNTYFQKVGCLGCLGVHGCLWRAQGSSRSWHAHAVTGQHPGPPTHPQVRAAMARFEERLWSVVRGFLAVSQRDPALLVTALQVGCAAAGAEQGATGALQDFGARRTAAALACACACAACSDWPTFQPTPPAPPLQQVVELQERVDAQLVGAGQGASPLRKAWRRRCLAQVGMCVQDAYAPLLQACSQLVAAGENTDRRVGEILAQADAFVDQVGGPAGLDGLGGPACGAAACDGSPSLGCCSCIASRPTCFGSACTPWHSPARCPASTRPRPAMGCSWRPPTTTCRPASRPRTAFSAWWWASTTASCRPWWTS